MRKIGKLSYPILLAVLAAAVQPDPAMAEQPKTVTLKSSRAAGTIDHVVVLLEVGGDVKAAEQGKVESDKMSVVCTLDYDERTLEVPAGGEPRFRSIRHYNKADAVIKVGEGGFKPTLRDGRRLVVAEIADGSETTLLSPSGPLTRDELDLIDILGNSLLMDRLLPEKPVAVDDTWKHSDKLIAALLGLDAVSESTVVSKLTEVTDAVARMEVAGEVQGAIGGVSTEIALKAKYRFDRRSNRIDWIGLLVKEKRSIGHVLRGVELVARLQMQIGPKADSAKLGDAVVEEAGVEPNDEQRQLEYESPKAGWRLTHDRCWFVYSADRDHVILRLIERGELVAQCNISPLPDFPVDKPETLAAFQEEIKQALGKKFGEFVEAGQWMNDQEHRVLRVVVRGMVEDLPIQWFYYLVADKQGRQVALAFTVEAKLLENLGEADRTLIDAMRFIERTPSSDDGDEKTPDEKDDADEKANDEK